MHKGQGSVHCGEQSACKSKSLNCICHKPCEASHTFCDLPHDTADTVSSMEHQMVSISRTHAHTRTRTRAHTNTQCTHKHAHTRTQTPMCAHMYTRTNTHMATHTQTPTPTPPHTPFIGWSHCYTVCQSLSLAVRTENSVGLLGGQAQTLLNPAT